MFFSYLKMAFRNFKKQKGYSFINLSGLAIGMACCILILLFVQDELSFDKYHEKSDRIHRLVIDGVVGGSLSHFAYAPFAAPPAFAQDIPEVESYVRLLQIGRQQPIIYEDKSFEEQGVFLADETFFEIFTHEFIAGNPENVLDEPGSVVITEETARRLFKDEDPIGKTIKWAPLGGMHVKGVIKDVPRNSHFSFNYIISFKSLNEQQRPTLEQWLSISGWGYLLLQEGADPKAVQEKFAPIVEKNTGETARKYGIELTYLLQKMTDIHLKSNLQGEIGTNGNIIYVYVFSAIALFMLLIACINFMNLSTARSSNRAREVGLRKMFGAHRKKLINQFLAESTLLALVGLIIAVMLAWLAMPAFNNFSGKELSINYLSKGIMLAGMLVLIIFTGLLAGSYPAFFLSGFQPISVFRGILSKGSKSSILRKFLVVFQFSISVALIAGTGIVIDQIKYMKNKNLGFDKEQVMVALIQSAETRKNQESVKSELLQNPNINNVTFSSVVPGRGGELRLFLPEGSTGSETHTMRVFRCDYNYLETYGMELLDGRNFSKDFATDIKDAFIINETAARKFGWMEGAVEKKLTFVEVKEGKVIGVVKDFHFTSLQSEIEPLVIMLDEQQFAFVSLKINTQNVSETIDYVRDKWGTFEPDREFNYFFIDNEFAAQYASEERLSEILISFAVIAIFIACLGLFGLASFTAEQRTKEIGIRKILGASPNNIVFNLSKEFIRWVLAANIIAWPAAYYVMNNYWLTNFPYRTNPHLWTFVLAGAASVVIAIITVGFQVFRASIANPADSLRYE